MPEFSNGRRVVTLLGDLVDTDPAQVREPADALLGVGPHPGHNRLHGAPGDAHHLTHRSFEHATVSQATVSSNA